MPQPPLPDPDQQRVTFYIEAGDYFATLATMLDCVRQELAGKRGVKPENVEPLLRIKKDLLFLQNHYRIVGKD